MLENYVIVAVHPDGKTAYDVELIASNERAAISRTRGTLFHKFQDWAWMEATYTVQSVIPYLPSRIPA